LSEPPSPERPEQPGIGRDEWVAQELRSERSAARRARDLFERTPAAAKLAVLVLPFAAYPLFVDSGYRLQVGIDTLVFVLLALGLNVVVGWVGLLDLGYVAFFGLGAYFYAALASEYAGRHWDAQWALPAIVASTALIGLLLGLPSRRLVGDYLAIVTLFFLQIFLVVVLNSSFTRGPNGISDLDPLTFFGREVRSLDASFYVLVVAMAGTIAVLYLVNRSRTGRAWRALREDELAAELLTMPVDWLKLLAFSFGAGIAGLAGALFAAQQGAIFPSSVAIPLLITVYAMVILGGTGSIFGVVFGAVLINASLEALQTPENASVLFFAALAIGLAVLLRPWWRFAAVAGGTIAFGFVVHAVAEQLRPSLVGGTTVGGARIDDLVSHWVLLPEGIVTGDGLPAGAPARLLYLGLVAAVLGLTLVRNSRWRDVLLVPTLYLACCVWENIMLPQPAVSRFILIGAMLVGLMAYRPQGLFGRHRVEVV
jgi:ABC-type branched-subunit amino acid transport system permease subunit